MKRPWQDCVDKIQPIYNSASDMVLNEEEIFERSNIKDHQITTSRFNENSSSSTF